MNSVESEPSAAETRYPQFSVDAAEERARDAGDIPALEAYRKDFEALAAMMEEQIRAETAETEGAPS